MVLFLSVELASWMPARLRGLYDSDKYFPAVPRILQEGNNCVQRMHENPENRTLCLVDGVPHESYQLPRNERCTRML